MMRFNNEHTHTHASFVSENRAREKKKYIYRIIEKEKRDAIDSAIDVRGGNQFFFPLSLVINYENIPVTAARIQKIWHNRIYNFPISNWNESK